MHSLKSVKEMTGKEKMNSSHRNFAIFPTINSMLFLYSHVKQDLCRDTISAVSIKTYLYSTLVNIIIKIYTRTSFTGKTCTHMHKPLPISKKKKDYLGKLTE